VSSEMRLHPENKILRQHVIEGGECRNPDNNIEEGGDKKVRTERHGSWEEKAGQRDSVPYLQVPPKGRETGLTGMRVASKWVRGWNVGNRVIKSF